MKRRFALALLALATSLSFGPNIVAAQDSSCRVTLQARRVAAEFESSELNREKVEPAGQSAVIYVGPLSPGTYPFFDDFHQSTRGRIVAK